ncbi:MAG: Rrf2 family transcriptional regulator [Desulfohalobiaceae bacterium]|nr:Rrf2 family transcriptional regulator [Desulfohalobiaceae bacterium]
MPHTLLPGDPEMKLSTRTRYGFRMLVSIAGAQETTSQPVPLYPIAVQQNISFKYLEKICRILKDKGYLRGKRGPDGGYRLRMPPEDIFLGELVKVLENEMNLIDCCLYETSCSQSPRCPTKQLWQDLRRTIIDRLNTYTLADLIHTPQVCLLEEPDPELSTKWRNSAP